MNDIEQVRRLQYMEVAGNEWEQWKARIWNSMVDRFGYPGLAPLEQWTRRSHKEQRCVDCGAKGDICVISSLIQCVPVYWLCTECDAYYKEKHKPV